MRKNNLKHNVIINNKTEFNLADFNDVDKIIKNSSEFFKNLYPEAALELDYQKKRNILIINKIIIKNIKEKNLNILRNRIIKSIKNAIDEDIKRKYEENPELYYKYLKESTLLNLYNSIEDLKENIKKEDIKAIEYETAHLIKFIHYSLLEDLKKFQNILNKKLDVVYEEYIVVKEKEKIKNELDDMFFEIERSENRLDFLLTYINNHKNSANKDIIKHAFNEIKNLDKTIENSLDSIYIYYLKTENAKLKKENIMLKTKLEEIKRNLTNKRKKIINTKTKLQ